MMSKKVKRYFVCNECSLPCALAQVKEPADDFCPHDKAEWEELDPQEYLDHFARASFGATR